MKKAELKKIIDKHTTCASDFDAIWNAVKETLADSHPSPMSADAKPFTEENVKDMIESDATYEWMANNMNEFIFEWLKSNAPSVKADGWVSVEDGLPEDGEDVLCISKSINCPVLANYNNSAFEVKKYPCPSDRVLIAYWEDVTHWQPLPNPPKQQL